MMGLMLSPIIFAVWGCAAAPQAPTMAQAQAAIQQMLDRNPPIVGIPLRAVPNGEPLTTGLLHAHFLARATPGPNLRSCLDDYALTTMGNRFFAGTVQTENHYSIEVRVGVFKATNVGAFERYNSSDKSYRASFRFKMTLNSVGRTLLRIVSTPPKLENAVPRADMSLSDEGKQLASTAPAFLFKETTWMAGFAKNAGFHVRRTTPPPKCPK